MTDVIASPREITKPPRRVRIVPARGWASLEFGELWAFRDLLWILMMRDVRLRYKQTLLGIVWVILQPLVASLIFAIIFGRFAALPSDGSPYLLFVFSAMLPWNIFAGALQRAGNSLIGDAKLISKVYFPRIVIPIASSLAVLVDFSVGLIVFLVLMLFNGVALTPNILLLPFFLGVTLLISVGISTFFSALNVYYRDFTYALPFLIQVWMYATPVVYTAALIPGPFKLLYAINPMVGVVDSFRWALLGKGDFPALSLSLSTLIGLILFLGSVAVFQRVERQFADVV